MWPRKYSSVLRRPSGSRLALPRAVGVSCGPNGSATNVLQWRWLEVGDLKSCSKLVLRHRCSKHFDINTFQLFKTMDWPAGLLVAAMLTPYCSLDKQWIGTRTFTWP